MRRWVIGLLAVLWTALAAPAAQAQILYAASFRNIAGGADGLAGGLYSVRLGTGTATFVAPLRLNGTASIGVTGLAVHPETGVFYGITPPQSPNQPQSLVSIDPATGRAALVTPLSRAGSDIAFNRAGILFMWMPNTSQVGIVNMSNGQVTPVGLPRGQGTASGLAIDSAGVGYITPAGASGTLDTIDLGTGAITPGPALSGAPFPTGVNSMTFTPSGLLLAVNSNAGSPASTKLVTINIATGAVSTIGTLPDDTDALTFADGGRRGESSLNVQTLALLVLGGIALVLGLIGWFVGRRPKA